MRRALIAMLLVGGSTWSASPAVGVVDLGSPGCQAVNAFTDGTVQSVVQYAQSLAGIVPYFYEGELIEATADFTGIGDGSGWLSAAVSDGNAWTGLSGSNGLPGAEVAIATREWVIDSTSQQGFYIYSYEGSPGPSLHDASWTLSCAPAIDTDGDGFWDHEDNFPDVYSKCREVQATIIGTGGADNPLNGTSGPDVIMGLGGGDVIYGLEGDDLICAGNGADTVHGGDGKDKIYGDNGADLIYGNAKSDRLYGGDNDDVILGGDGTRDRLYGGAGVNDLDGGAGDDDRCTLGPTFNRCEITF